MRSMSYTELAYEVISSFVHTEDIPSEILQKIINKSFSTFRTKGNTFLISQFLCFNYCYVLSFVCCPFNTAVSEVTPVVKLGEFWVLELFHGPTFAFKDVALQFLGNVFEYFLEKGSIQKTITILGATSGDTGSAAIHGLRGKANVNCFIMFPLGKVTEIQERQMTTILDENVHCMSIKVYMSRKTEPDIFSSFSHSICMR